MEGGSILEYDLSKIHKKTRSTWGRQQGQHTCTSTPQLVESHSTSPESDLVSAEIDRHFDDPSLGYSIELQTSSVVASMHGKVLIIFTEVKFMP